MTTSIYAHFILSKMSLRGQLIFELSFRERALFHFPTVIELFLFQHHLQMF